MHRKTEFVFVVAVAAVAISAMIYLTFFLSGATDTPTAQVVANTSSPGAAFMGFLAAFVLVVVCATVVYHFWKEKQ